jgi:predicted MFS family arabinose efflux permease
MHQSGPMPVSAAYKRLVIALLTAAYTCNAMDRGVIPIIGQSMKLDLQLTDTQLGLLSGTAFALLYAFGGIPLARLAERANRVNVITIALAVWSALSALCGAASGFQQLLFIRVGVGVAESGCSPPAHSLISDYFAPSQRASALSIYSCGISLGYLAAAVGGGYVAQRWGWRAACASVGLPGIVIAAAIKYWIREPPRAAGSIVPSFSLGAEWHELRAVGRALIFDRPVLHMVLGVTTGGFAAYGFYAFVPAYFSRAYGLGYAATGAITGFAGGVAVGLGILAGGFIADGLAKRDMRWYAWVPGLGGLLAVPLYLLALLPADWRVATGLLATAGFFQYASLGPTFGVVQNVVDRRRRATATALLYISLNVFALGGGPLFTGWMIDRFADADLVEQTAARAPPRAAAHFKTDCPGGAAAVGADGGAQSACRAALVRATRQGLEVTLMFFVWACIHYLLASLRLAKSLKASALHR